MILDTVERVRNAFYRLTGTEADDPALTEHGEDPNEVANLFLTRGCRNAQRWMLDVGYDGWAKRTSALTFSGSDDADGGRFTDLPEDFLRARGNRRQSALRAPDGTRWGKETDPEEDHLRGDFYYVKGEQLWLLKNAQPPSTVFLDYHHQHPAWDAGLDDEDIEFPVDARWLIPAEAAAVAMEEYWLPGDQAMERKIERARARAREESRLVARQTKSPRQMRKATRIANHW